MLEVPNNQKSERKGGRMLMMKNRLINNSNTACHNDILRSGTYSSTKNGSIQRETTPLKNLTQTNKGMMKSSLT